MDLTNASGHITVCQTGSFFFNQVLDPICQWLYHGLIDRVFSFFFQSGFQPCMPMTISQAHRPGFFHFFSIRFSTLYANGHDCLTDQVFFIFFFNQVLTENKMKKLSLRDQNMVTGIQGWKLDWKKMKKKPSVRPLYGYWRTGLKTWLKNMTRCVRQWYDHQWVNKVLKKSSQKFSLKSMKVFFLSRLFFKFFVKFIIFLKHFLNYWFRWFLVV